MNATRSIVIVSGIWLLSACGQGPEANSDLTSAQEVEELTGVNNCLSEGRACKADAATAADVTACEDQVRACFANLVHDDAGLRPRCDGARPPNDDDAGQGPRDDRDAARPPDDDGGHGPVVAPDGGRRAAIEACLTTLRDCITGGTAPMTCGQDARSCLEQIFHR